MTRSEHQAPLLGDDALEPELQQLLLGEAARFGDGDGDGTEREAARRVVKQFRGRELRRRVVVAAAAVVSLAAAVGLTLHRRVPSGATEAGAPVPVAVKASRYALEGGVASTPLGATLAVGERLGAGTVQLGAGACIAGIDGRLCASMPLGAVVVLPDASAAPLVMLTRGAVSFSALSGVGVATIHGNVVALTSALFTLELASSAAYSDVAVQDGSVRYHDLAGAEASLFAGQRVRLGAPAPPNRDSAPAVPSVTPAVAPSSTLVHVAPALSAQPSVASAGDLLELARQERAARHYAAAALAYRKLEQSFPSSAEARAALVSLGQLQLGQLGQPEAALRSFQAYLAAPGQLQQEAEHGSILALQKLGRVAEERRAIEGFLRRFPKSVPAGALKERLKQL